MEEAQRLSVPVGEALTRAAEQAGWQVAAGSADLASVLASLGYEPRDADTGEIELANCPFHELRVRHPELVCTLNLHLLRAVLASLAVPARARLDPAEGRCCVAISPGEAGAANPRNWLGPRQPHR